MNYLSTYLTIIGLVFDIIGAAFIFKKGLVAELDEAILSDPKLKSTSSIDEIKKMNKDIFISKIGFKFLILGFTFQLLGSSFTLFMGHCAS